MVIRFLTLQYRIIVMKMFLINKLLCLLCIPFVCCNIINLEVHKYVDIVSQLVKIDLTIMFRNDGPVQIQNYNFAVDPDVTNAYVEFYSTEKLQFRKFNSSLYVVHLHKPILPQSHGLINVEVIYMDMIKTLMDKDRKERTVQYTGNLYFYSLYETLQYTVIYHVDRLQVLEISREPSTQNTTDFKYEYKNIQPYSFENVSVVYVNDVAFFVVTKLERTIDVSHLGFIFVEDSVHLINEGPKLTAIYEPPIQRLPQLLHTHLPASAFNMKLFDDIGNNSKSSLIHEDSHVTLRFEARYPLRRSWKTRYILQYNVPVYEYLRRSENMFFLKMRVVDHILPDVLVRDGRTRVILPQDSVVLSVTVSEGVKRGPDELSATSLAYNRTTVTFLVKNLPENVIPDFYIAYKTPFFGIFKAALFISAYIEVALISCIAFRRIDTYLRYS